MTIIRLMIITLFACPTTYAQSQHSLLEAWAGFSEPQIMGSGFTHDLRALPLEGSVAGGPKLWSGPYWPTNKGGVNQRWNTTSEHKEGFGYRSPNRAAVLAMGPAELAALAPTEKFDLFLGRYDYPLKKEAEGTADRRAKEWNGICHGWAPASLHHNEPTPKTVTNPDGLQIPFGSSDIKALLSYYYAFHTPRDGGQMGQRCFFGAWLGGVRGCANDLNAGAFHIVLANKIGLQKSGFLMDVDRYKEVWNQPVVGFKSKVLDAHLPVSRSAATAAVREVRVATELYFVDESDPTWNVVHGTKDQLVDKKELVYRLELSADDKIVGGEWESEERPDFFWTKEKITKFEGLFSRLPELLND